MIQWDLHSRPWSKSKWFRNGLDSILLERMPGMGEPPSNPEALDDKELSRSKWWFNRWPNKSNSRHHRYITNASYRKRFGRSFEEVQGLFERFLQTRAMMGQFGQSGMMQNLMIGMNPFGGGGNPFGGRNPFGGGMPPMGGMGGMNPFEWDFHNRNSVKVSTKDLGGSKMEMHKRARRSK